MEAKLSIYKIDINKVKEIIESKPSKWESITTNQCFIRLRNRIIKNLIDNNAEIITDKSLKHSLKTEEIIIYRKSNMPLWFPTIYERYKILNKSKIDDISSKDKNSSISYIYLNQIDDTIYASTGGKSSFEINKYIEQGFGLQLVSRLFSEHDIAVSQTNEKNMVGNKVGIKSVNRKLTNFNAERDFMKIFKGVITQINFGIGSILGIAGNSTIDDFSQCSMDAGHSIRINKTLTIKEYKDVLKNVHKLLQEKPKFALSYFVPVQFYHKNAQYYFEKLIELIISDDLSSKDFSLVGEDSFEFLGGDKYYLKDEKGNVIISSKIPIDFEKVYEAYLSALGNKKKSYASLKRMFKNWKITVLKNKAVIVENEPIFNLIEVNFVTLESGDKGASKLTVFLSGGGWYYLDAQFNSMIDEEFKELNESSDITNSIFINHDLLRSYPNEELYNDSFETTLSPTVVNADRLQMGGIEICDLIVFDSSSTYLLCNKSKPNGSQSRDLNNQIRSSAMMIRNSSHLQKYFNKLKKRGHPLILGMEFKEFREKMKSATYVAVYINERLTNAKNSSYAKLLSLETRKDLRKLDFEYYINSIEDFPLTSN